jgi:hypothetical protein
VALPAKTAKIALAQALPPSQLKSGSAAFFSTAALRLMGNG